MTVLLTVLWKQKDTEVTATERNFKRIISILFDSDKTILEVGTNLILYKNK